jgi:hypothetical protein
MYLVQQSAAAHGNLALQKLVIKQRGHGAAKKQILLDLMLVRPRHHCLMS